jgi:dolichol-phosphate mannosyltransferase
MNEWFVLTLQRKDQLVSYMNESDSIVIIPTYNEKENIEKIIRAVFALEKCFHILVIDDGSPDGTAAIVKGLMQQEFTDRLFLIERTGKLGLGTAYIAGFKWGLAQGYDYIFEMDADFSHAPSDLPRLYSACADEGYDLAIGSRYISGVNVVNWPMGRVLMSYFASKYVRFITGFKVHDTTAGFKCYRRRVLETIDLDAIRFKGYAFQIEMKFTTYKCGFKIKEVPVIFVNRVEGVSKMNSGIFGEAFFGVMRLRWDGWFRKYPKPVDNKTAQAITGEQSENSTNRKNNL